MLYLVGTPIGNLEDFSFRAVRLLKSADYILCEDTRKTRILAKQYDVKTNLVSFHRFNERARQQRVIEDLQENRSICLVSDAGMPAICDPGSRLVRACHAKNLPVSVIPGPSALSSAMSMIGCIDLPVQFCGFMPKSAGKLQKALEMAICYKGISLFFDTPHRILKTLYSLCQLDPKRPVAVAREMTKIYEQHLEGTPQALIDHFVQKKPKGEFVFVVYGIAYCFDEENLIVKKAKC